MRVFVIPLLAALILPPLPAVAQPFGNALNGRDYAKANCADCHAIEANGIKSPDPRAPKFETIANTPGMTETALTVWLYSPHRNMPQILVRGRDLDDLAAYMQSLKRLSQEKPKAQ